MGPEYCCWPLPVDIRKGCCGRSAQLQWLWWEAPGPSTMWRWWASRVPHHGVWVLEGLGTVDDMGLHHTLIKTQCNFSTDSRPSRCNYGGMLPGVCCCCSNLSYTVPRMQEQGVSMTCPRGTGKGKESCATQRKVWNRGPEFFCGIA